jgi:hypothetical protein
MKVELVKSEDLKNHHFSRFSESPHFLIQAAADPQLPNKCPCYPPPRSPTNFETPGLRSDGKAAACVGQKYLQKLDELNCDIWSSSKLVLASAEYW